MARRRGRFSERILEKAPRKGRKKISKKKTPKVAAKPRVIEDIQIDIPEIINIPGIGQIELPKSKPKPKPKAKAKPKPKAKAKVKARPTPKPRPVKLPDILQEDIRIAPGTLAGLIGGAGAAKEKPKPKKEVKTPKKGKIREREDIRVNVPTREDIDKIIKDLDIKIPKVIDIPGMGQVTIPTAPKPPVDTPTELPKFPKPGDPDIDFRLGTPGGPGGGSGGRGGIFGRLPDPSNLSELDKLKQRFDMLTGMRFVKDPGPEHYQKIKELGDQIYALDKNFKSDYYTPGDQSAPPLIEARPMPVPGPGGPIIDVGRDPAPDLPPAPEPPTRVDTTPRPTPPAGPMPPPLVNVDAFKGFKESYRPANIVGQSFDPSVRDDYEKQMQAARASMMQPGGNIRSTEYPTYQTPTLAVPQTQFGGYGQPMPISPLLPYAGLASSVTPEQVERRREPASGARVNPGTGEIEPIGMAPDTRLLNLPPGVSGPIR